MHAETDADERRFPTPNAALGDGTFELTKGLGGEPSISICVHLRLFPFSSAIPLLTIGVTQLSGVDHVAR